MLKRTATPFSACLDNVKKYVTSKTLKEPLPWLDSTLIEGDVGDAVARLKSEVEKDMVIFGSRELIQSLLRKNRIDQHSLLIHPQVLGTGRRLFTDGGARSSLRLVNIKITENGVVIATYLPN